MDEKMRNIKKIVLVVIVLGLAVGAAFAAIDFWKNYMAERARINKQIEMLNQKQEVITDLEVKLDRAQKDMRILIDNNPADPQDQYITQVKDAYFLARLAEDRLQYGSDVQAAKQLLQLSQEHLASFNTPEVLDVKNIIEADQKKLSDLNYPDIKDMNEKLAVLDQLINTLPLKQNTQNMTIDKEWGPSLHKMLEDLKKVVKIRKKSDPDVDLSYINVEISKAQFKLLIEQIRWAIYYKDSVVYQRSIKNAQDLLSQLFDVSNENVQKFSKTLDQLALVHVQNNLPSISNAVTAIQGLLIR